ncbi:MAG: tetratricopeptide repeat protein [Steroidobacteraceae bacterium]
MLRKIMVCSALVAAIVVGGTAVAAGSDPTVHQIYEAAQSGQVAQAEQMVGQVLEDHPKSGEAHYVAAEVYARAGDFATARRELDTAQALEPGLPFARPQSVQALERELTQGRFVQRVQRVPYAPNAASFYARPRSSRFWSLVLVLIAGAVIFWAVLRRRSQPVFYPPQYSGQPGMPPAGVGPMGSGGVVPPYPYGYGGGLGSGLMGSIGTGLAVGAGVAAGEALVHRMMSGPQRGGIFPAANADIVPPAGNDDMGGADFGVSDGGSWADAGGGNPGGGADVGARGDGWT